MVTEADRDALTRLRVWLGPPPRDLGRHPDTLAELAAETRADVVILDSLKDMAVGLADDDIGAGVNRAIQTALAEGIKVAAVHHQRKGVGPLTLEHDHETGTTVVNHGPADPLVMLRHAPGGLTISDVARVLFATADPNDNEKKRAERNLDRLVRDGLAYHQPLTRGGPGGSQAGRYLAAESNGQSNGHAGSVDKQRTPTDTTEAKSC
jgi:replicative DNA helicase